MQHNKKSAIHTAPSLYNIVMLIPYMLTHTGLAERHRKAVFTFARRPRPTPLTGRFNDV